MSLAPARRAIVFLLLATLGSATLADSTFHPNMPRGVTELSRDMYLLHMTIFWICVAVGVLVFSIMFYAILWHRKSRGAVAAQFHENSVVEFFWTLIPFLILVAMAWPATQVVLRMHETKEDVDLTIKVVGYQWRWGYEYLGEGVTFLSNLTTTQDQINNRDVKGEHYLREVDNHLVLPVGKKIRFLITSNDVIHSWWVPELGIKKDAIPGFINEYWTKIDTPGIYRGQCAELCGILHGFMPIVVEAREATEYSAWLNSKKAPPPAPASCPAPAPTAAPATTPVSPPAAKTSAPAPAADPATTKTTTPTPAAPPSAPVPSATPAPAAAPTETAPKPTTPPEPTPAAPPAPAAPPPPTTASPSAPSNLPRSP